MIVRGNKIYDYPRYWTKANILQRLNGVIVKDYKKLTNLPTLVLRDLFLEKAGSCLVLDLERASLLDGLMTEIMKDYKYDTKAKEYCMVSYTSKLGHTLDMFGYVQGSFFYFFTGKKKKNISNIEDFKIEETYATLDELRTAMEEYEPVWY